MNILTISFVLEEIRRNSYSHKRGISGNNNGGDDKDVVGLLKFLPRG